MAGGNRQTRSTTLMSQSCSSRSVGKFSAALTCRGRRWGRGGSGWGESCGRLLVLLFALLVTLGLLGGSWVLWLFVLLLVLLFLFFLIGRSPHPAQQP